jgi:hypothetical protein
MIVDNRAPLHMKISLDIKAFSKLVMSRYMLLKFALALAAAHSSI